MVHELHEYDFDRRVEICEIFSESDNRIPPLLYTTYQYPQKLKVWAGILDNRIIGPFCFIPSINNAFKLDLLLQNWIFSTK